MIRFGGMMLDDSVKINISYNLHPFNGTPVSNLLGSSTPAGALLEFIATFTSILESLGGDASFQNLVYGSEDDGWTVSIGDAKIMESSILIKNILVDVCIGHSVIFLFRFHYRSKCV